MENKILVYIPCFTFLLLGLFQTTTAQQVSVGVSGGVASRWGSFGKVKSAGAGYTLEARYVLKDKLALGFNYKSFSFGPETKTAANVKYNLYYSCITVAAEYYILTYSKRRFRPSIGIEGGRYNYYTITTIDFGDPIGKNSQKLDKNYWGFGPSIGLSYRLSSRFDAYLFNRYDVVFIEQGSPIGFASLNLGVRFDILKKKEK
jgi:Outer membrane protein beta-barrel domain